MGALAFLSAEVTANNCCNDRYNAPSWPAGAREWIAINWRSLFSREVERSTLQPNSESACKSDSVGNRCGGKHAGSAGRGDAEIKVHPGAAVPALLVKGSMVGSIDGKTALSVEKKKSD